MTDKKIKTVPAKLLLHPAHFLSLGFGSGLLPKAPGTFGTLAAIPLYLLMSYYLTNVLYAIVTVAMLVIGIWICDITERAIGTHDHGSIVWDEVVGFLITMLFAPVSWWTVLAGFVLFRLFDILKPFPISWLDRHMQGGLGTMMDDVAAGIMAWASLQLVLVLVPTVTGN